MFRFCNHSPVRAWVVFEWYRPNCPDGGNWQKKGWWSLEPGECKTVFGPDLRSLSACYYYYAEADDGSVWAGNIPESVPNRAFDWCATTSSSDSRTVGLREVCTGNFANYTVNLVR